MTPTPPTIRQEQLYIFCNEQNGHLHEFRMLDADENVRRMSTDLQDTALYNQQLRVVTSWH